MSGARQSTFDAIRKTIDDIKPQGDPVPGVPPWQGGRLLAPGPAWSWRSTGDPGMFELWRDGQAVGTLSLLPGHVQHRAVLLDTIVDHLNSQDRQ